MNCQNCNTILDYHFQTNCDHCETEQPSLPVQPIMDAVPVESRSRWPRRIINFAYLLVSSFIAMFLGAAVLFHGAVITCRLFLDGTGNASHDCARGNFIGLLVILTGGFLGTIGGSVFAVKKPICK